MNKNFKIFLLSFFFAGAVFVGANFLNIFSENVFFNLAIEDKPPLAEASDVFDKYYLAADISQKNSSPSSCLMFEDEESTTSAALENVSAKSVLVLKLKKGEVFFEVIYENKMTGKMPIASLTKLMTGLIVEEFYDFEQTIEISQEAVTQPEDFGKLKVEQRIKVGDLQKTLLVESSNDAAFALTEIIGYDAFINLMNLKASKIGLKDTIFYNTSGLDPSSDQYSDRINQSTALDIAKLMAWIIENDLQMFGLLGAKQAAVFFADGTMHHIAINTNELLGNFENMVGGKTGFTKSAGGCLVTVVDGRQEKDTYFINVILGSNDRFEDMKKIIQCFNYVSQ